MRIIVGLLMAFVMLLGAAPASAAERPDRFVTKLFDTDTVKTRVTMGVKGKGRTAKVVCFQVRTDRQGHTRSIDAWNANRHVVRNMRVSRGKNTGCARGVWFHATSSVVKVRVTEDIPGPFNLRRTHNIWVW